MAQHLIVQLPEYWVGAQTERGPELNEIYLNDLGFQGWELIEIKNLHAFFIQHTVPIAYKFVKNDTYTADLETTLNVVGNNKWMFILVSKGYSVFKQIQVA